MSVEHPDISKERSTMMQMEDTCNRLIEENDMLNRVQDGLVKSLLETTKELQNEWEDLLRPFCNDDASQKARDVINRAARAIQATEKR